MDSAFSQQYELVRGARAALLDYCATLPPEALTVPVAAFNGGCMRDLLMHVAGAYQVWLGQVALGRLEQPTPAAEVADVASVRARFAEVDALMADFGQRFAGCWLVARPFQLPRHPAPLVLTPLHGVSHEFHHKGQVLSMSRLLGHAPVDTDVIRF